MDPIRKIYESSTKIRNKERNNKTTNGNWRNDSSPGREPKKTTLADNKKYKTRNSETRTWPINKKYISLMDLKRLKIGCWITTRCSKAAYPHHILKLNRKWISEFVKRVYPSFFDVGESANFCGMEIGREVTKLKETKRDKKNNHISICLSIKFYVEQYLLWRWFQK